jgi:hypothetical protein
MLSLSSVSCLLGAPVISKHRLLLLIHDIKTEPYSAVAGLNNNPCYCFGSVVHIFSPFHFYSDYELSVRQQPKQARMCGVGSEHFLSFKFFTFY